MKRAVWPWVLAPGAFGLGLSLYYAYLAPSNDVVYLRVSASILVLLLGAGISAAAILLAWWNARMARRQADNLERSADERRRFLRRLDHEMKNPLTAIRAGLANLAETQAETRVEVNQRAAFESIEAQTLRLSRLATDLRKLAELEVRLVERAPVDIPVLLQEAFDLTQDQPNAVPRLLSLSIPHAPWPLPRITGDPDLLFLAVYNLLENALKFTRPGDTIELRAFEDGATLVIEVADTGPGIPLEEQPHVWEELFRGESGRGAAGSGLGLALVRAIVERHQGQVNLRSRPGQGSVFSLRLPVGGASVTKR